MKETIKSSSYQNADVWNIKRTVRATKHIDIQELIFEFSCNLAQNYIMK